MAEEAAAVGVCAGIDIDREGRNRFAGNEVNRGYRLAVIAFIAGIGGDDDRGNVGARIASARNFVATTRLADEPRCDRWRHRLRRRRGWRGDDWSGILLGEPRVSRPGRSARFGLPGSGFRCGHGDLFVRRLTGSASGESQRKCGDGDDRGYAHRLVPSLARQGRTHDFGAECRLNGSQPRRTVGEIRPWRV